MADSKAFSEGMRAYRQGRHAQAAAALEPLVSRRDLVGRLARYYCAMAQRACGIEDIQAGRLAGGIDRLRRAVGLVGPQSELVEYLLGAYARAGRYEDAVAEAEVLTEQNNQDVSAQVRLAQAQWRSGRWPVAIMTLTAAIRRLGDHAELHLHLGLFHAARNQHELACRHLGKAIECDCTCTRAMRYLGLSRAASGDFAPAAEAFARALALEPQDALTAYHLCQSVAAARQQGHTVTLAIPVAARAAQESEIGQLAEYAASEPDFVDAFLSLPESEADEELFGVLASVLRVAIAAHPDYADLHHYAARTMERLKDTPAAIGHARRAVETNPHYAKALAHLAELEHRTGASADALEHLRRAIRAGADWADVHCRLGDLLRECGQADEAASHYRRALQLNQRYQRAAEGLSGLAA